MSEEEAIPETLREQACRSYGKTEKGVNLTRTTNEDTIAYAGKIEFGESDAVDSLLKLINQERSNQDQPPLTLQNLKQRYDTLVKEGKVLAIDIVVDGMGGHEASEKASAAFCILIFDNLLSAYESVEVVSDEIDQKIKGSVMEALRELHKSCYRTVLPKDSGITLSLSVVDKSRTARVINSDDVRTYVLSKDGGDRLTEAKLKTRDRTRNWNLVRCGAESPLFLVEPVGKSDVFGLGIAGSRISALPKQLTRLESMSVTRVRLKQNDIVVTCDDGVWDGLWTEFEMKPRLRDLLGKIKQLNCPYEPDGSFDYDARWQKELKINWRRLTGEQREDIIVDLQSVLMLQFFQEEGAHEAEAMLGKLLKEEVLIRGNDNAAAVVTEYNGDSWAADENLYAYYYNQVQAGWERMCSLTTKDVFKMGATKEEPVFSVQQQELLRQIRQYIFHVLPKEQVTDLLKGNKMQELISGFVEDKYVYPPSPKADLAKQAELEAVDQTDEPLTMSIPEERRLANVYAARLDDLLNELRGEAKKEGGKYSLAEYFVQKLSRGEKIWYCLQALHLVACLQAVLPSD